MDEQGQRPSSIPIYLILALVGTASGLYLIPKALESARPPPVKPDAYKVEVGEVDARLSEDPLAAVYEDSKKSQAAEAPRTDKAAVQEELQDVLEQGLRWVMPVEIPERVRGRGSSGPSSVWVRRISGARRCRLLRRQVENTPLPTHQDAGRRQGQMPSQEEGQARRGMRH